MASARRVATSPELPAALRERFFVIDDFLPLELAETMRRAIDDHFAEPARHTPETHQVWNYWFVPELYAYLRTQPEKVIANGSVVAFLSRLQAWSTQTLGLARITWPYLSLYVSGCRQGLHNDSVNGRFGYVYSLTRNERRTSGGETIVHREGDAFRTLRAEPGASHAFFDAIEPRFNRLVVFDDRMPHAVERVDGSMDPREGRFVLHGHISESEPIIAGALSGEILVGAARRALEAFAAGRFLDGYHGPLTLLIAVEPDGRVSACRVLLDRVIHPDAGDRRWPGLLGELVRSFEAIQFPAADGQSKLLMPVMFGAGLPRG
jgi:hypothetical protein